MNKGTTSFFLFTTVTIILSGCSVSGPGYMKANHNGLTYWVPDRAKCETFRYQKDGSTEIQCFHNGQAYGSPLRPATQQQLTQKAIEESNSANELNSSLRNLNQTVNSINRNMGNQINSFDASQYDLSRQREKPVNCSGVIYGNAYNMGHL